MLKELLKFGLTPGIILILERYNINSINSLKALCVSNELYIIPGFGYARIRRVNKALIKYDQANNYIQNTQYKKLQTENQNDNLENEFHNLPITNTQKKILHYMAQGCTNQVICEKLTLSERSIRYHLQQLKLIYNAKTSNQLIYNILTDSEIIA